MSTTTEVQAPTRTAVMFWENWGPYHHARHRHAQELFRAQGVELVGVEVFRTSRDYIWSTDFVTEGVLRLNINVRLSSPLRYAAVFVALVRLFRDIRPIASFIPSYNGWAGIALITSRLLMVKAIMMNETHDGTARHRCLLGRLAKRVVIGSFASALVGGERHRRYFASLGLHPDQIFLGYDAVDNEFFEREAHLAVTARRAEPNELGPYFLNVGRFVSKKNLRTLIDAYGEFYAAAADRGADLIPKLILAGYGPEEETLRRHATAVTKRTGMPKGQIAFFGPQSPDLVAQMMSGATAFILPSTLEEWGLVVNEAMASGCPVIVSREAGCAEDLVEHCVTGLTFDPSRSGDLAGCLTTVWGDEKMRRALADAGRRRIRDYGCQRFATGAWLAYCAGTESRVPTLGRVD